MNLLFIGKYLKKLKNIEVFIYSFLFLFFNLFFLVFFTPPDSIVFYELDSRRNIDEILQILNPTSIYDFIYDAAFGGVYTYGRLFHLFYALILGVLKLINMNIFSDEQLIMITNYNLLFFGVLISSKYLIPDKIIRNLFLVTFLFLQPSSVIQSETTSFEIFLSSIAVYFFYSKKYPFSKFLSIFFIFGLMSGIKLPNITFFLFGLFLLENRNFKNYFKAVFFFILGLIVSQPMIIIPKGFRYFYENIYHHVFNYFEETITYTDWLTIIYVNYGYFFSIIIFILGLFIFVLKFKEIDYLKKVFFLGSLFQIISYLFSNGVIRAHFTKISMLYLLLISISLLNLYFKIKNLIGALCLTTLLFSLNTLIDQKVDINYFKYKKIKISSIYELDPNIKKMREVENYVLDLAVKNNIHTVWWDIKEGLYYPYSNFHWTSTEIPNKNDIIIREIWSNQEKFLEDNCYEYGGILVFIDNEMRILDSLNDLNFKFDNKFLLSNSNEEYYFIFLKPESGLPLNC